VLCNTTSEIQKPNQTKYEIGGIVINPPGVNITKPAIFFKNTILFNKLLRELSNGLLKTDIVDAFGIKEDRELPTMEFFYATLYAEPYNVSLNFKEKYDILFVVSQTNKTSNQTKCSYAKPFKYYQRAVWISLFDLFPFGFVIFSVGKK
jgi:hypothetical protein